MKTFSENHTAIDDSEMYIDIENQILVIGEVIKVKEKKFQILEILSPVLKLRVKEIKDNG